MPHEAADDRHRVVPRQHRTRHVECADVGRGLADSGRVRGEDEACKRLPMHIAGIIPYLNVWVLSV